MGEARKRRATRMSRREALVSAASALLFVAAAAAVIVFVPNERDVDLPLIVGLTATYAVVSRVRFEFGPSWVSPEQLVFVPMVLLVPLEAVPALVGVAVVLSMAPDVLNGDWHRDRLVGGLADNWFYSRTGHRARGSRSWPGVAGVRRGLCARACCAPGLRPGVDARQEPPLGSHPIHDPIRETGPEPPASTSILSPVALMFAVVGCGPHLGTASDLSPGLASRGLRPRPQGALRQCSGASAGVPRHGHPAVRRRGVRRSLHSSS